MTIDIFASDLRPMEFWALRASDRVKAWSTGKIDGRSTGFKSLDPYMRLIDTELTLIAARPSMGKTSLAMQMAENVGRQLQREHDPGVVAVFSAEMAGDELVIRMASAWAGLNSHQLRHAKGKPEDYRRLEDAIVGLSHLPIWMDDSTSPSTAKMLEQLTRLNETMPVRLMLFDFTELGGDKAQNEELRISSILQHLKGIAKTLRIPVVTLNQLNRDVERRPNKLPALSDMRYSGMAEQIADKVVFLMRPEYYEERKEPIDVPEADKRGIAYVLIAKNRNGPVGMVKMAFVKEKIQFADLAHSTAAK